MVDNLVQWQAKYSLNIKEIDEQHKIFINLINEVYGTIIKVKQTYLIDQVISKLVDYAALHFMTEEKYFIDFNYSESISHIKEHKYFLGKIDQFQKDFNINNLLSFQVLYFMKDWLIKHILISDKKYIDCFKKGGLC